MSTLIIINTPPYASSNLQGATDVLLTLAAFELKPDLLLKGEGVRLLQLSQASPIDGIKTPYKVLNALPVYDINNIYIEATALERYGITQTHLNTLPLTYQLIEADDMRSWLNKYQHCMAF